MMWEEICLDEVLNFHSNERIPLSTLERDNRKGSYRYYGAQGVIDYIDDFIFDGEYVLIAEDGANLTTRNQPIAFKVDGQFWVNNHAHVVRAKEGKTLNYFITILLNNLNIAGYVTGAAQPKLNQKNLKQIKVKLPPLPTQRKIAVILAAYDDLIENNLKRIALLEKSARLLYEEWFVRLRFPGHEYAKIVDRVPEGWERTFVPDIIDINPKTKVPKDSENWYVEMAALATDSMVISNPTLKEGNSGSKFKNDDILFARITPCLENGKTGYVNFLEEGKTACGSTEFIVLRGRRVPSEFVYCLSRTYDFRENAIKNMVGSSGRQRVKVTCFDEFPVPLPPKAIVESFEESVGPCFKQIKALSTQNQKLKQARDILLPKLINGEITV